MSEKYNIRNNSTRKKFIREMNNKWQRKYNDYRAYLDEIDSLRE